METLKQKEIVLTQIFYLFLLPVFLLYFNIIPGNYRFLVLFSVSILLLGIIRKYKWTHEDVGFKKDWWSDWQPYLLFTLGSVFFLLWLETIVPHSPMLDWYDNKKFLLLFAPISILQEIVFRVVLLKMLIQAFSDIKVVIFINALVFALIHVIYLNAGFVLPLTFIAGIGFAWAYYQYKNLILISIAHTVLNFTAM